MRSVSARLDIHADTLVGEDGVPKWDEQTNVPIVHEPPRRCQISLPLFRKIRDPANPEDDDDDDDDLLGMAPGDDMDGDMDDEDFQLMRSGSGVMVSDFLFPGETPYESVESVKEVFGFYPSIDTMDDDMEMVASPQQMMIIKVHAWPILPPLVLPVQVTPHGPPEPKSPTEKPKTNPYCITS